MNKYLIRCSLVLASITSCSGEVNTSTPGLDPVPRSAPVASETFAPPITVNPSGEGGHSVGLMPSVEGQAPATPAPRTMPGAVGEQMNTQAPVVPEAVRCESEPLERQLRPLNGTQYLSTLSAVFHEAALLPNPHQLSDRSVEFSSDGALRRFDLTASQIIRDNGRRLASGTAVAEVQQRFDCLANADEACVRTVVESLGRELYRQPVEETHLTKLIALFEDANAKKDQQTALGFLIRAMVSSPRFLFRSEMGAPDPTNPGHFRLTPHEMADAISYTLTNSPPDADLRAAADNGSLADPAHVRAHAKRLLESNFENRIGLTSFVGEVLAVADFMNLDKDEDVFPAFDAETREQMFDDFQQTVDGRLSSATPTLEELLTTREFVARPRSAEALGLSGNFSIQGTAYTSKEPGRMGVLAHPVFLATYAHPEKTNPVGRGHFIMSEILCNEVPAVPDDVVFPEPTQDLVRTQRQEIEEDHSVGACAGCHSLMDPLGFPFEVFDGIGRLRESDNGLPIDTTGSVVGTGEVDGPVANVEELLTKVATSERAKACFAGKAFRYISGLDSEATAPCQMAKLTETFTAKDHIPDLFLNVLTSESFTVRSADVAAQ